MNDITSIQTTSNKPIYIVITVIFLALLGISNMVSYTAGERSAMEKLDIGAKARASEDELLAFYMDKMTLHENEIRVIDKVLTAEQKKILKTELANLE